jgi:hypothetical protein
MNKFVVFTFFGLLLAGVYFFLETRLGETTYDPKAAQMAEVSKDERVEEKQKPTSAHVKTPETVKAIYMTACVLSTVEFKQELVDLIDQTEINSIVIDIKDFSGTISFPSDNPKLYGLQGTGCKATGVKEFVQMLHDKNIYVIGRVTVFQDNVMTKLRPDLAVKRASDGGVWKDHKGISFIDVGAKEHWDYMVELA